jgi:hypothetical protein
MVGKETAILGRRGLEVPTLLKGDGATIGLLRRRW